MDGAYPRFRAWITSRVASKARVTAPVRRTLHAPAGVPVAAAGRGCTRRTSGRPPRS